MHSLSADPVFGSYLAVVLIALGLVGLLGLGPRFGSLTLSRRWTLLAIRLAVVLLVLVALLRPTKISTEKTPRTSVLVILFDISRSMQLPNGRGTTVSRWEAEKALLERVQPQLAALAADYELRIYSFDSQLHAIEHQAGRFPLPAKPDGAQTDYGTTLYEALRPEQGKRVAGVILLGDGAQTAFEPRVETQEAARKVRDDFAAPLFTVTFGPAADAAQSRDIAIDRLDEQFTVFVKNELSLKGLVRIRGYVNQPIPVELVLEDEKGARKTIGTKSVQTSEDGKQVEVEFSYAPQQAGHFRLHLVAAQQEGELVAKNNQLSAYLTVLEGGMRILYLDGEKRHEQRFIRRALNASPDIELDDRIVDRRNLKSRGGSQAAFDLVNDLQTGRYDAFILGDLDRSLLTPESWRELTSQVSAGKGLLMIGGEQSSFGWGHFHGAAVEAALPIVLDPLEGTDLSGASRDRFFIDGPVAMQPAAPHPLTRLASDALNESTWKKLPPLLWAHKFAGVKDGGGVRVVLESPQHEPLLVTGEYGSGRVLAFAGESTYRWQMQGFEKEHKRFWRQLILWLVRREDLNRDEVWVKIDQRRFNPGSQAQITAGARTTGGELIPDAKIEAVLVTPGGKEQPLRLAKDKSGGYSAAVQLKEPGDYAVKTLATLDGKTLGTAKAEFLVFDRDVELGNPAADPDQMASLAAWTKQDGGKPLAPEQLSEILTDYQKRDKEYEVRQTKWKLGSTRADAWLFFAALVGFLSVEWFLRKKWGLV